MPPHAAQQPVRPDCSGAWRCGVTRLGADEQLAESLVDLRRLDGREAEANARHPATSRSTSAPVSSLFAALAADVHSGEHDLAVMPGQHARLARSRPRRGCDVRHERSSRQKVQCSSHRPGCAAALALGLASRQHRATSGDAIACAIVSSPRRERSPAPSAARRSKRVRCLRVRPRNPSRPIAVPRCGAPRRVLAGAGRRPIRGHGAAVEHCVGVSGASPSRRPAPRPSHGPGFAVVLIGATAESAQVEFHVARPPRSAPSWRVGDRAARSGMHFPLRSALDPDAPCASTTSLQKARPSPELRTRGMWGVFTCSNLRKMMSWYSAESRHRRRPPGIRACSFGRALGVTVTARAERVSVLNQVAEHALDERLIGIHGLGVVAPRGRGEHVPAARGSPTRARLPAAATRGAAPRGGARGATPPAVRPRAGPR